jgi:protein-disulfide isomerase-like protein with CxxC motif
MEQLYASQYRPACTATIRVSTDQAYVKVQSRRKYKFTDQIDQLIREIYLNHRDAKTRPGIRALAKKVGMPHWALKKRARELGLARTKELPWSARGN